MEKKHFLKTTINDFQYYLSCKKVKCNYIMFYFITTTYFKNFKYFSEVINEDTKIG